MIVPVITCDVVCERLMHAVSHGDFNRRQAEIKITGKRDIPEIGGNGIKIGCVHIVLAIRGQPIRGKCGIKICQVGGDDLDAVYPWSVNHAKGELSL